MNGNATKPHRKSWWSDKLSCFLVVGVLFVWGLWGAVARCKFEPNRSLTDRIVRTVTFQPIEAPQALVQNVTNYTNGIAGEPGQLGPQGSKGPTGAVGQSGEQGRQGESGDPASDDQTIDFNSSTSALSIDGGNMVDLSALAVDNVDDADSDPTNELQGATTGGGLMVAANNSLGLLTTCGAWQILKWDGSAWYCEDVATVMGALNDVNVVSAASGDILRFDGTHWIPGVDANTAYSAGNGLSLVGTVFDARLTAGGGLMTTTSNAISLLNTCSNDQFLAWNSSGLEWHCTSPSSMKTYSTITGDTGTAVADSNSDTLSMLGGDGITVTASDNPELVSISADIASGGGLTFSGGQMRIMPCNNGQILKVTGGNWSCAPDDITPNVIYRQQLSGVDDTAIHSSFTPLLTNGSGTPQAVPLTITSGSQVGFVATYEFSSTLGTGSVVLAIVRDDNGDNDCGTAPGDGTRVGGLATENITALGVAYAKTISFVDDSPPVTSLKYQLCASTTIATGAVVATDRSLRLEEVAY